MKGSWCAGLGLAVLLSSGAISTRQAADRTPAAREDAYRANNFGVARLEQFDYPAAVQSFRRALEIAPNLGIARANLAIALYYAGELEPARQEAEAARKQAPELLQAPYVLGLVARAANQNAGAIAAFEQVHRADPDDVGTAINLGQLYLQEQKFPEAVEAFRRATTLEPYQATAAYGLATALLRSGAREEGAAAMARFQKLRDSGYATTFSQNYLEQGRYAAALASTGAEPELVDTTVPDVRFTDATRQVIPDIGPAAISGLTLFDPDGDGDLDLALVTGGRVAVLRNTSGTFKEDTALSVPGAARVLAGDTNNDGRPDLLVLTNDRIALLQQQPDGAFKDATASSGIPRFGTATAALSDADHDGDLDIVAPGRLLRNNGNGTFVDLGTSAGLTGAAIAIAPTDFDNRRDIDFLMLNASNGPMLFQNMRDGSFRDSAAAVGLPREGPWMSLAAGDVNKDGFVDFFFGRGDGRPGVLAASDGHGRFTPGDAPPETARAHAAQFLDYDNDGLLDLLVVNAARSAPVIVRNIGKGWTDVTARAFSGVSAALAPGDRSAEIASGDLDDDGDVDTIVASGGRVTVWRNEGGNRHASLKVRLAARVSNRSALGSKIEMRAGSLSQLLETMSASPSLAPADAIFGLGARNGADVVRVLWPAGILQAEVAAEDKPLEGVTTIQELDRKPSSCPYLYTWNGKRFEFITDFLGGGEMGYWMAPGVRNTPDPDEYVRIESSQLQPRNGRYELRITNELEEALFLDHARLIAVDHPDGTDAYPNEGMGEKPKPFELFVTRDTRPPLAAVDEHGHDVLEQIARLDRTYPDDFTLEAIRGYAKPHALTLTLPPRTAGERKVLLITGWTDYAFSRDNVAASQQGLRLEPPSLQVRDAGGRWRTVIADIGIPVGRPQTVPVDLTGIVPADATQIRIATTMRIYWDRVAIATKRGQSPLSGADGRGKRGQSPLSGTDAPTMGTVPVVAATLRWRGFSEEVTPDGREPFGYDYARVTPDSPWKLLPGRYTREGDVAELLTKVDDMFVVSRPGDEIALSFDATALPALPSGWTRTFLLYADGFSKEMDPHSSSPDTLEPLPFHAMSEYPYAPPERYPDDEAHRRYVEHYNTRVVLKSVPRIDTQLLDSPLGTRRTPK